MVLSHERQEPLTGEKEDPATPLASVAVIPVERADGAALTLPQVGFGFSRVMLVIVIAKTERTGRSQARNGLEGGLDPAISFRWFGWLLAEGGDSKE